MPTEDEYTAVWAGHTPQERRERLNELGSIVEKTDDEWNEHNSLATTVAVDERVEQDAETKPQE